MSKTRCSYDIVDTMSISYILCRYHAYISTIMILYLLQITSTSIDIDMISSGTCTAVDIDLISIRYRHVLVLSTVLLSISPISIRYRHCRIAKQFRHMS